MVVGDSVHSHAFIRELSRQINGLRTTTRPKKKIPSASSFQELHFRQTPQHLKKPRSDAQFDNGHDRELVIDTYASIPCLSCAQVDDESGLVCETCDRVQHLKCMSTCPIEACPKGDWYCEDCRLLPLHNRDAPCVACGVLDGTSCDVRCDRCGRNWHAHHWPAASSSAKPFFCDQCREAAGEDARLYVRSNALWDGVDGNICSIDGTYFDRASDSAARFLSSTEPNVFAVSANGSQHLRFALHVPRHCKRTAFEVVQASSTKLFDSCASKLAPRCVYLLTGKRFDMPQANAFCRSFSPLRAHVGHTDEWIVPSGCSALVPMSIDLNTWSIFSLPNDLTRHFGDGCQRQSSIQEYINDMFNVVEFYCGLGCFIDGAGRSGHLGWGAGVESDPEIAKAFASYARGNGNIDTFVAKVESILGLPGHVVEHGGDAKRFLDALKTRPVDVMAGSPLCEGFSSLNAHSTGDAARLKRNHLKYWGQAVMKFKPEYAVMENVPEVMSPKYKQNLSTLLLQLAGCGYQLQCYVLSSWAFGAGSDRERFVLLATRLGTPFPPNLQPFHAKKNVHPHDTGVRWAFASKRAWVGADSRENAHLPRCVTLADVLETLGQPNVPPRKAHVVGNLHSARIESVRVQSLMDGVPTTSNACYATIPHSIRAANAVPRYEKNLTTTGKLGYRRLQSNKPARSPTKKCSPEGMQGCVMHPTESRVCTPAEKLCAMGFAYERLPDAKLSVGHAMAGNAFSPLVAKALFDVMAVSRSRKRKRQGSGIEGGRNHDGSPQLRPWENATRRARAE